MHGHNFLVIADRFTGWNAIVSTPQGKFNVQHLVTIMNDFCATLNIPEHITRDGGPQMMSGVFQKWMKDWDITHRLSTATTEPRQQSGLPRGCFKIVCQGDGRIDNNKFVKAIGTPVAIQNQSGWYPTKLNQTGMIM